MYKVFCSSREQHSQMALRDRTGLGKIMLTSFTTEADLYRNSGDLQIWRKEPDPGQDIQAFLEGSPSLPTSLSIKPPSHQLEHHSRYHFTLDLTTAEKSALAAGCFFFHICSHNSKEHSPSYSLALSFISI